jgi:hypothetical protein
VLKFFGCRDVIIELHAVKTHNMANRAPAKSTLAVPHHQHIVEAPHIVPLLALFEETSLAFGVPRQGPFLD